jgi:hypothetical protein
MNRLKLIKYFQIQIGMGLRLHMRHSCFPPKATGAMV